MMHKTIEVSYKNTKSCFALSIFNRSKLYGTKKRVPVDVYGRKCISASLTIDGRFILPTGSTGILFLDEKNDIADKKKLKAINEDGIEVHQNPSTLNTTQQLGELINAEELLDYSIRSIYILEPISVSIEFDEQVSQFSVFRIPFQYAASYHSYESFVLKNDNCWFLLIGEKLDFDFIGLDQADLSIPECESEEFMDQIDFAMI